MQKIRTHYENLKVAQNAPESVIKAAYKALCQTYHPDKNQVTKIEAERIMRIINASYSVLINPIKRAEHDAWIKKVSNENVNDEFQAVNTSEDIFESANNNQNKPENGFYKQDSQVKTNRAVKSRMISGILAVLLGGVGAHRFYLGYFAIGLLQILVTFATGGYGILWGFIEGLLIFGKTFKIDASGRPLK